MKKYILILCALLSTNSLQSTIKHIVLDLDGILIKPDTKKAIDSLGWSNLLWKGFNAVNLQTDFFEALDKVCPYQNEKKETVLWQGKQAPCPIWQFLTGKKSCDQLVTDMKHGIKKLKRSDEELLLNLTEITFNPQKNAEIMQLIPEGIQLLKDLNHNKYTVHLIANWNNDAWQHLNKRFSHEFSLINGHTFISGVQGTTKGNPIFYKEFYKKADIKIFEEWVFIETEQVYTHMLLETCPEEKKPKTIVCVNKDIRNLRQQLINHGVLAHSNQIHNHGHHTYHHKK